MKAMFCAAVVAAGWWAGSAQAALVPVPAFTGTTSESFEAFANYYANPHFFEVQPATILQGTATISARNADLTIYQPGADAWFGLGDYGYAAVQDGQKALGLNSPDDLATIAFASRVNTIGGYWGVYKSNARSPIITFTFYDGATEVGSTSLTYAGGDSLTWAGWSSTVPFDSFTFSGVFVAVDSLQVAVPEPSSAMALLLGTALLGIRRCRG